MDLVIFPSLSQWYLILANGSVIFERWWDFTRYTPWFCRTVCHGPWSWSWWVTWSLFYLKKHAAVFTAATSSLLRLSWHIHFYSNVLKHAGRRWNIAASTLSIIVTEFLLPVAGATCCQNFLYTQKPVKFFNFLWLNWLMCLLSSIHLVGCKTTNNIDLTLNADIVQADSTLV